VTNHFPYRAPFQGLRYAAAALLFVLGASCSRNSGLPAPGSPQYSQAVSAFYVGLAGLQTGVDELAKEKLTLATQRQREFKSKHEYTLEEFGLSRDWIQQELGGLLEHYTLPR